jgi:hypothetical protein
VAKLVVSSKDNKEEDKDSKASAAVSRAVECKAEDRWEANSVDNNSVDNKEEDKDSKASAADRAGALDPSSKECKAEDRWVDNNSKEEINPDQ